MCLACQITQWMAVVEGRLHPAPSEWLLTELAVLTEGYALRNHPYMVARDHDALTDSDLQLLATEYHHVIVATAAVAARTPGIPPDVATLAEREIRRWRTFATAVGWYGARVWCYGEDPFPETVALARCLSGRGAMSAAEAVARIYALGAVQGEDADGLTRLFEDTLSTMPVDDPFAVLTAARETLEALWRFYGRLYAHRAAVQEVVA
jgi:hypothetical protein